MARTRCDGVAHDEPISGLQFLGGLEDQDRQPLGGLSGQVWEQGLPLPCPSRLSECSYHGELKLGHAV